MKKSAEQQALLPIPLIPSSIRMLIMHAVHCFHYLLCLLHKQSFDVLVSTAVRLKSTNVFRCSDEEENISSWELGFYTTNSKSR